MMARTSIRTGMAVNGGSGKIKYSEWTQAFTGKCTAYHAETKKRTSCVLTPRGEDSQYEKVIDHIMEAFYSAMLVDTIPQTGSAHCSVNGKVDPGLILPTDSLYGIASLMTSRSKRAKRLYSWLLPWLVVVEGVLHRAGGAAQNTNYAAPVIVPISIVPKSIYRPWRARAVIVPEATARYLAVRYALRRISTCEST